MTKQEAIDTFERAALQVAENNEETLNLRINDEMLENDELWKVILSEIEDPYDKDLANETRDILQAAKVLNSTLKF